jgi:hypothetical protein
MKILLLLVLSVSSIFSYQPPLYQSSSDYYSSFPVSKNDNNFFHASLNYENKEDIHNEQQSSFDGARNFPSKRAIANTQSQQVNLLIF